MHHDFDSLGVTFHPVVVIGLGKNLLFKSVLAHCADAVTLFQSLRVRVHSQQKSVPNLI